MRKNSVQWCSFKLDLKIMKLYTLLKRQQNADKHCKIRDGARTLIGEGVYVHIFSCG